MFDKPGVVEFLKGETLFSFFPVDLHYLEDFDVITRSIQSDNTFYQKFNTYSESRQEHIDENNSDWQKYYLQGSTPYNSNKHPNHRSKINLNKF